MTRALPIAVALWALALAAVAVPLAVWSSPGILEAARSLGCLALAVASLLGASAAAFVWLGEAGTWAQGKVHWRSILLHLLGWTGTVLYFGAVAWYIATRELR